MSFYGDDIGLLATPARQLGLVGDAVPSQPPAIVQALAEGLVPVVAPLAVGPLNVNADEAAAALAIGLGATRIVFCSDVPGLLRARPRSALHRSARGQRAACRGGAARRDGAEAQRGGRRRTAGRSRRDRTDPGLGMTQTVDSPVLATYARQDVTFVSGEGCWLVSDTGREYLDLLAGIAVVGLGHCHPTPLAAAAEQLERLWHASNLYWTEPMAMLAGLLSHRFPGAQAFFCNSGAEGVEAALKLARKATGRPGVVAVDGSFHGRTLGALSVTGQPAKRTGFEPLLADVTFVPLNDAEALAAAVSSGTGCVIVEPVQGEGGVHPATVDFLAAAREAADDAGALLVFDEVQTGVGRTGSFFCFEQSGIAPDAVTLAKGLANGLPIGALLVADRWSDAFTPGDHASTFGGNPVTCAAACATVTAITDELLANVGERSRQVRAAFPQARGAGLLLGVDVEADAGDVVDACADRGVLVGTAGPNTVRITPPLTITADELAGGLATLLEVLES